METQDIGKALMQARLDKKLSRRALVTASSMNGILTGEGLRKIEFGERIPKFSTLRVLASTLGINDANLRKLEKTALEKQVERIAKRAHREKVVFQVEGKTVRQLNTPPSSKLEGKVREIVDELATIVDKYGIMEEDVAHFRRHARSTLLKKLST